MTPETRLGLAFMLARSRYPELHKTWISISVRVGGLLPNSLLVTSVQRTGELDMVLRAMEDDFSPAREGAGEVDLFSFHYQKMLSELWVCDVYEIFRLLTDKNRKLAPKSDVITVLARPLRSMKSRLNRRRISCLRRSQAAAGEVARDRCQITEILLVRTASLIGEDRRSLGTRRRGAAGVGRHGKLTRNERR
jgi:hypothetical protein